MHVPLKEGNNSVLSGNIIHSSNHCTFVCEPTWLQSKISPGFNPIFHLALRPHFCNHMTKIRSKQGNTDVLIVIPAPPAQAVPLLSVPPKSSGLCLKLFRGIVTCLSFIMVFCRTTHALKCVVTEDVSNFVGWVGTLTH